MSNVILIPTRTSYNLNAHADVNSIQKSFELMDAAKLESAPYDSLVFRFKRQMSLSKITITPFPANKLGRIICYTPPSSGLMSYSTVKRIISIYSAGSLGNQLAYSDNFGVRWDYIPSGWITYNFYPATLKTWRDIAFGVVSAYAWFVAVASDSTSGGRTMYSEAGIFWTEIEVYSGDDNSWQAIAYGEEIFVIVANAGTYRTAYSTNGGHSWTPVSDGVAGTWNSIAYGNGVFIAASTDKLLRSVDLGISWTQITPKGLEGTGEWRSIAYGNGIWSIVAPSGGLYQCMISTDEGLTWIEKTLPTSDEFLRIKYENDMFIIFSEDTGNVIITRDFLNYWVYSIENHSTSKDICYGYGFFWYSQYDKLFRSYQYGVV